jgi:hypothetical protein
VVPDLQINGSTMSVTPDQNSGSANTAVLV